MRGVLGVSNEEGTEEVKRNEGFELRVKKYLSFLARLRCDCTERQSAARVPIQRPSKRSIDTRHLSLSPSFSPSPSFLFRARDKIFRGYIEKQSVWAVVDVREERSARFPPSRSLTS